MTTQELEQAAPGADQSAAAEPREQMNIVIVGHVDHGKSTVIGRLLADTGSLPEGKLERVRAHCRRNARPFEYAFLLDALKDEQSQGITIDVARCFFRTERRKYIIIDAPGHIEFLKNMITGASRAEAALLVIDGAEGIRENSRRHGFMISMLGIRQIAVLVNKMDLLGYDQARYDAIVAEFSAFMAGINALPLAFIPVSAREGDNLAHRSASMPWYDGPTALELIDSLDKEKPKESQPFRFPVQDIYKFTAAGDDRRIVAGTVESGRIAVGDEVVFLPSLKESRVSSIEGFNTPPLETTGAGNATGFTLETQIYIRPGEIMCRKGEPLPAAGDRFRANLFWVGEQPMAPGKEYKLKIAAGRATVTLTEIVNVIDASSLDPGTNKPRIDRHDVAEVVLQTERPIAFDLIGEIEGTARFVIVDGYEIAGGGIIVESLEGERSALRERERAAHRESARAGSPIRCVRRAARYHRKPVAGIIAVEKSDLIEEIAKQLEEKLFSEGKLVIPIIK